MKALVFIPINKDINMEQAEKLAYEVSSFLVDGYICRLERDASNPLCIVILSKDKK